MSENKDNIIIPNHVTFKDDVSSMQYILNCKVTVIECRVMNFENYKNGTRHFENHKK